jgi:mRNA-degrading endonuclease RelE of RelBE toxin-antitoxin system
MPPQRRFKLIYDPQATRHLSQIERKHHSLIRREIKTSLTYEPETETRNRKPLSRPSALGTAWELRFGPDNCFRVFYRTDLEQEEVYVLAIGVKQGNRLFVGGKEFQL